MMPPPPPKILKGRRRRRMQPPPPRPSACATKNDVVAMEESASGGERAEIDHDFVLANAYKMFLQSIRDGGYETYLSRRIESQDQEQQPAEIGQCQKPKLPSAVSMSTSIQRQATTQPPPPPPPRRKPSSKTTSKFHNNEQPARACPPPPPQRPRGRSISSIQTSAGRRSGRGSGNAYTNDDNNETATQSTSTSARQPLPLSGEDGCRLIDNLNEQGIDEEELHADEQMEGIESRYQEWLTQRYCDDVGNDDDDDDDYDDDSVNEASSYIQHMKHTYINALGHGKNKFSLGQNRTSEKIEDPIEFLEGCDPQDSDVSSCSDNCTDLSENDDDEQHFQLIANLQEYISKLN